jgi:hypothetical protein
VSAPPVEEGRKKYLTPSSDRPPLSLSPLPSLSPPLTGFTNVVSVPDGAPRDVKEGALPDPEEDVKFSYLWASRGVLDMAVRIIIATDSDGPGQALSEELARRLGRERCWRVKWPTAEEGSADEPPVKAPSLKDANEVLMAKGPDALKKAVQGAEPYPIRGLFRSVLSSSGCGRGVRICPCTPARRKKRPSGAGVGQCGLRMSQTLSRALPLSRLSALVTPFSPSFLHSQLCGLRVRDLGVICGPEDGRPGRFERVGEP